MRAALGGLADASAAAPGRSACLPGLESRTFDRLPRNIDIPAPASFADYKGNVTAEVAYTALSDRWDMPSTYYSKELSFKGSDGAAFSAHLIAIDTVMLAGMTTGEDPTQQPPGPADATAATSQWDWIEAQLAGSTADFVFVFGHYPVISGELHCKAADNRGGGCLAAQPPC